MKCEHVIAKIGSEITICGKAPKYILGDRKDGTPGNMHAEKLCGIHALFWARRGFVVTMIPRSSPPSPKIYAEDEIVEVLLPTPTLGSATYVRCRVIRRSGTHLHVHVTGTGTELAIPKWTMWKTVRRLP